MFGILNSLALLLGTCLAYAALPTMPSAPALASAPAQAPQPPAGGPVWFCNVQVELKGDGNYYRLYGRDSWRGTGPIVCHSSLGEDTRSLEMVFNSLVGDVGADEKSKLLVTAAFWTLTAPSVFQARTVIKNTIANPYYLWEFASQLTGVRARVWAALSPNLKSSLSHGTLLLRSEVQVVQ